MMSLSLSFGKLMAQRSLVQQQIPLRAQIAWARIQDNPIEVIFTRNNRDMPSQTVRLEYSDTRYSDVESEAGVGSAKYLIIFGIAGHPEYDDTDIKEWDTFRFDDQEYTVRAVNRLVQGEVQAEAVAI